MHSLKYFFFLTLLLCQFGFANDVASPYLKILNKNATTDRMPLLMTTVDASISGLIVEVKVTQIYKNNGDIPLEAQYVFPGSRRAAVHQVTMKIAERVLKAEIQEKQQARKTYQQAKFEGKTTSLLEQKDPGLFTMRVANILPDDEIEVELVYSERLIPENGKYTFSYPAIGIPSVLNNKKDHAPIKNDAEMGFDMIVQLNSPIEINAINSINHKVDVHYLNPNEAQVLLDVNETLNFKEDFIIEYSLLGNKINTGLLMYEDSVKNESYFLLMIEPPKVIKSDELLPREYIFVMDSSGSMAGHPLKVAQEVSKQLLSELKNNELFNVILFAGGSQLLSNHSMSPTKSNLNEAYKMIDISTAGGGTNLLSAIEKVQSIPLTEGYSRSLIVLTDGGIDVSLATMNLIRENNHKQSVFAIGVSQYNNDMPAIEKIAQAGNGQEFIINDLQKLDEMQQQFLDYVRYPLLTDIKIDTFGFEKLDLQPSHLPDLFSKRPLFLTGKFSASAKGSLQISGTGGQAKFSNIFDLSRIQSEEKNKAIQHLWAKEKVIALGDGYLYDGLDNASKIKEITAIGLAYNLLTAYTSFVAVDKTIRNTQSISKTGNSENLKTFSFNSASYGYGSIEDSSATLLHKKIPALFVDSPLAQNELESQVRQTGLQKRPSITFILGRDSSLSNPYYSSATKIFKNNPDYKTDFIVTDLNTIAQVKSYLKNNHQQTWGLINIVTHSTPWSGLSIKLNSADEQILDVYHLNKILSKPTFMPLANAVIDNSTEIRILGCALGQHKQLLNLLSVYFGGKDLARPLIKSPKDFVLMSLDDLQIKTFENGFTLAHPRDKNNEQKLIKLVTKQTKNKVQTLENWNQQQVQISVSVLDSRGMTRKSAIEIARLQPSLTLTLQELNADWSDFSWSKTKMDKQWLVTGKSLLFSQKVKRINPRSLEVLDFNDTESIQVTGSTR